MFACFSPIMSMPICSPIMPMSNFAGFSRTAGSGVRANVSLICVDSNLGAFYNDQKNLEVAKYKAKYLNYKA